jgi:hypothetical protein
VKIVTLPLGTGLILPLLLGAVVAAITFAARGEVRSPIVIEPKAGLLAVLVVGFAMCTLGGSGKVAASGRWLSPGAIAGSALGVTILVIGAAGLTGWRLPLIQTPQDAVTAVAVVIGVKTVIGTLGYVYRFL